MSIEQPHARYEQIADLLRAAIERGDYAPGSRLEPESELAGRYGVDRRVINRAILSLRADGLVRVERGRGTFTRKLPVLPREAVERQRIRDRGGARGAFGAEMEAQGRTHLDRTEVAELPAPADVAELLGIEPGSPALSRRRHTHADDVPVQISRSWLPVDIARGTQLTQGDTGPGGSYSRLADLGHGPAEFTETVRIRPPTGEETAFLQLDGEQRVYSIRRTATDPAGRIVEVNDMVLPAHQWELIYRWPAER